jgi:hypothetical protein
MGKIFLEILFVPSVCFAQLFGRPTWPVKDKNLPLIKYRSTQYDSNLITLGFKAICDTLIWLEIKSNPDFKQKSFLLIPHKDHLNFFENCLLSLQIAYVFA